MNFNCRWPDGSHQISFALRINNIDLSDDSSFNLVNIPGDQPINQPMGTSNNSVTIKSGIMNDPSGILRLKLMGLVASTHLVTLTDDPATGTVPPELTSIPVWYYQKKEIIRRRGYIEQVEVSITLTEPGQEYSPEV